MIPYSRPTISKKDLVHVLEAMLSDQVEYGELTKRFEHQFAAAVGMPHALAVHSAGAAFFLVFKHLDLKPGDEVILPAYGEPLLLEILSLFGATPRFADLKEGSYGMDLSLVPPLVGENTRAVIVSHTFGFPLAIPEDFLKDSPVALIEDCTHALGSTRSGVNPGLRGNFSVFSLDTESVITTGEGGMVLCRKKTDHDRINDRRAYRLKEEIAGRIDLALSDLQSAMGVSELSLLPKFLDKRKKMAAFYRDALSRGVNRIFEVEESVEPNWSRFPVQFSSPRATIKDLFKKYRIGVADPWPKPLFEYAGLTDEAFPNARRAFLKTLCVPLYPVLKVDEVEEIGKLLSNIR